MELRPYQQEFKRAIYQAIKDGHRRIMSQLVMGGGKTVIFTNICESAYSQGRPVVVVVKRRRLISQASQTFRRAGLSHGIYMADHPQYRPKAKVQVCSVDTLGSRAIYPHADNPNTVLIIDEAHDCTPQNNRYSKLVKQYKGTIIGFTATPFADNSLWDKIVVTSYAHEIRDMGHLVPEKIFRPGFIEVGREMDDNDIFDLVAKKQIVGDVVETWKKYSQGRPTIVFAVNVKHSKMLEEAFNDAGIKMRHCDATTPEKKREHYIRQMVSGRIQGLVNVNLFTTGVDIPEVSCLQMCRPTQSLIWHLQALGRGLRPAPGKEDCIVIDNVGNVLRFGGGAYVIREAKIGRKKDYEEKFLIKECKECFFIFQKGNVCPECGASNIKETEGGREPPKSIEGELIQHQLSPKELEEQERKILMIDYHKLKRVAEWKEFHPRWVYHQIKKKHKMETIVKHRRIINFPLELL